MRRLRSLPSRFAVSMILSLLLYGSVVAQDTSEEGEADIVVKLIPIHVPAFPSSDPDSNQSGDPDGSRADREYPVNDLVLPSDAQSGPEGGAAPDPIGRAASAAVYRLAVEPGDVTKEITFTSPGYGGAEISLHPDAPGPVDASLYRILENGQRQSAGWSVVNPGRSLSLSVEPGRYAWVIGALRPFVGSALEVALSLIEDAFEPDSQYRPRHTAVGQVETVVFHARNDVDWFLIEAQLGGLRVLLDPDAPTSVMSVDMYRVVDNPFFGIAAGERIDGALAIQRGGGYTLHVPKAGRYLIAIAGGYGRDEVRVAFTHIPDPYEPDSFAQPRAVVLGQPVPFIASSPRDVDYFAFRVPAGNGVKVRLDQRAPYGVAVRLYEENAENPFVSGKQISRVSVRPGAAATLELPGPGRYLAAIEPDFHGSDTFYLTFELP